MIKTIFVALALVSTGCVTAQMQQEAARVRVLDPQPLVDMADSSEGMTLQIDPKVRDQFMTPEQFGITAVPVEGWHTSLQNGFRNGIGRFYKGGKGSWKLVILNADLDYVTSAVYTQGAQVLGAAAAHARLRYVVRVMDPKGRVVVRDQAEVFSTNAWMTAGGSSTTASEAIAAMYENVARRLAAP